MIKLIASQLDQAFWDQKKEFKVSALNQTLQQVTAHQAHLAFLTNNCYPYLLGKFQKVTSPLDYVAENGAEVVANGVNIKEHLMDAVTLGKLLDWVSRKPDFMTAKQILSSKTDTITNVQTDDPFYKKALQVYPTMHHVDDLIMTAGKVYQIRFNFILPHADAYAQELKEKFKDTVKIIKRDPKSFYVVDPEASFGAGLATLQKHYGARNRQTAAIGNQLIDLAALNAAKYSYALADSPKELASVAQPLTGSDNQAVILKKIQELLQQK